jgi:hypothetical protein
MGKSEATAGAGSAAKPAKRRRWLRRVSIAMVAILLLLSFAAYRLDLVNLLRTPGVPFDARTAPPAPDYARQGAWLAWPGRPGLERSTQAGVTAIDPARAPADVFFIHPTTIHGNNVWNAPYDAGNDTAPLNPPVLLEQVSAFNGCCRMYAPRYRQATLAGLKNPPAFALAYSDVQRAFRYYIAHLNHGRPFIIASHSQGTGHAVRLLQDEIIGTPLQSRMVAAYLIGGYAPADFARIGLPICDASRQTGCVLSYNTSQQGRSGARILVDHPTYWWQGAPRSDHPSPAICVNPLTWTQTGTAMADTNMGSVPFPKPPFSAGPVQLPLVRHLTGATCRRNLLEVDIPYSAPSGFHDALSFLYGSYHLSDYGVFYAALRRNAIDRVDAFVAARKKPAVRPSR